MTPQPINSTSDDEFCKKVLNYRDILNRVVILCEGDREYLNIHTPQQIGRLDKIPDANFWKATIPSWWRTKKPVFIPCGSRTDVLRIKKRLLELHDQDPQNSYLSPKKLLALIDLDVQSAVLHSISSSYNTTEDLYHQTYKNNQIDLQPLEETQVIVTGWIHKEAYFLEPDLGKFFLENFNLSYGKLPLSLDIIYQNMSQDILNDKDIQCNLNSLWQRIKDLFPTLMKDKTTLLDEWQKQYANPAITPQQKRQLIEALLKLVKAKLYWKQIIINDPYLDEAEARDNLELSIARFYADSYSEPSQILSHYYHIHYWVKLFYKLK